MIKNVGLRAVNKKKKEDIRVVTGMDYVFKGFPSMQYRETKFSGERISRTLFLLLFYSLP
jgi:hypothetical protein